MPWYWARFLWAAALFFACLPLTGCGGAGAGPAPALSSAAPSPLALAVYQQANAVRLAEGLDPLLWHAEAAEVAGRHAVQMMAQQRLAHIDVHGLDPGQRLDAAGITVRAWGENLAQGSADARAIVAGWLASPEHRANLLEPRFQYMGIGVAGSGSDTWCTQILLTLPENLPQ